MTEMRQPQRPPTALQRVVDEDEQLVGRFPALAAPIYAAVTTDQAFDQPRTDLLHALTDTMCVHAEYDEATREKSDDTAEQSVLNQAIAAQHRSLAARVDELEEAATGLDVVAITRAVYAVLSLTLDLERRTLQIP